MKSAAGRLLTFVFLIVAFGLFGSVAVVQSRAPTSCHVGNPSPCNDANCPDAPEDTAVCIAMLCDSGIGTEFCMKPEIFP